MGMLAPEGSQVSGCWCCRVPWSRRRAETDHVSAARDRRRLFPTCRNPRADTDRRAAELIVIVCAAGRGTACCGRRVHQVAVPAGQVLVIPRGLPHLYEADARRALDDLVDVTSWASRCPTSSQRWAPRRTSRSSASATRHPSSPRRHDHPAHGARRDDGEPPGSGAAWHAMALLAADRRTIGRQQSDPIAATIEHLRANVSTRISLADLAGMAGLSGLALLRAVPAGHGLRRAGVPDPSAHGHGARAPRHHRPAHRVRGRPGRVQRPPLLLPSVPPDPRHEPDRVPLAAASCTPLDELADAMQSEPVRPGLWYRPLLVGPRPSSGLREGRDGPYALDPSHPAPLDTVSEDIARSVGWGFQLIKHDFSTYDAFSRWGPNMARRGIGDDASTT